MEYYISEEPKNDVYEKLIKYACKESEMFSFQVTKKFQHEKMLTKQFNKMCKLLNVSKEEVIKNFNNPEFMEFAYNKLKDRKGIIRKWTYPLKGIDKKLNKTEAEINEIKARGIKMDIDDMIFVGAGKYIFAQRMKEIKEILEKDFIKKEEWEYSDTYYYKISDELEKLLIKQGRLYNMLFPDFPEDIRFYKNDNWWIETISHEELGFIKIEDIEVYNYLSDIGLKLEKCEN